MWNAANSPQKQRKPQRLSPLNGGSTGVPWWPEEDPRRPRSRATEVGHTRLHSKEECRRLVRIALRFLAWNKRGTDVLHCWRDTSTDIGHIVTRMRERATTLKCRDQR